MAVAFSFNAFAHNELLARHLVSFGGALTTRCTDSTKRSLASSTGRILYQFVDSNTGGRAVVEVVKTHPSSRGRGIFKCVISKVSVKICEEDASSNEVPSSERDHPVEERIPPVYNSLVIAAESSTQRPTLLPPRLGCSRLTVPLVPFPQNAPLPASLGNLCLDAPSRCT